VVRQVEKKRLIRRRGKANTVSCSRIREARDLMQVLEAASAWDVVVQLKEMTARSCAAPHAKQMLEELWYAQMREISSGRVGAPRGQ
jgi:hypothetical protein